MTMTLEEVSARLEIEQVLYRYCRGVDRGDRALIASVYHDGAIDEHGSWSGEGKTFGEHLVPAMDAVPLTGQHHITNALIDVHGDRADAESYFVAFHPQDGEQDRPVHVLVGGRYLDRFELRGGAWRIAHRAVVIDVSRILSEVDAWNGAALFPNGKRREADPSATVLPAGFGADPISRRPGSST